MLTRGKCSKVEVLACPVTWRRHPEQIASAERGYKDWWQALDQVREGLATGGMLRETERTARKVYRSRDAARADVFDYIERFYNPRRRHSKRGYLSPMAFEERAMQT
ncbi:integrase-like protein [Salipiger aestuarii]|uniref:Integrase-like protein n=1 Tax=Salipiger aestuarii TaxID=568098 RepID=A0A327XT68_9RHOB|nr:transposase [Citreicella sp. 357]RAK11257.1 integrase-like protein [Salipiger aestuarii]